MIAFFIRVFYISEKAGIHIDEGFTHVISSFIDYQYKKNFETGKIYTGKELKSTVFKNNTTLKDALKDAIALRKNNNGNKDHTPLYHTCYLLWTHGGSEVLTPKEFINKGCSLNLLFFILEFFIMYKILQKLFPDSPVIIAGLAAAFLSTGSISNTLLIRLYQMQELAFVFLAYVFIENFQKISVKESIINSKNGIFIALGTAFSMLTGYYAGIYIFLLGSILIFLCIKNKMYKNLLFLFSCLIPAVILIFAFYPGFLKGFRTYQFNDAANQLIVTDIKIIRDSLYINLQHVFNILVNYLLYIPLLFVLAFSLFEKKEKYNKLSLILIIIGLIFSAGIIHIAPFKVMRYIAPVFPLISLIIPMMLFSVKNICRTIFIPVTLLIILINALFPYSTIGYDKSPQFTDNNYFRAKIENINDLDFKESKFMLKPDIPVIIVNNPNWPYCLNLIFNMPDEQKYEFVNDINKIPDKYNHYFLIIEKPYVKSEPRKFKLSKHYIIADKFSPARFDGYEIIKK